MKLTKNEKYKDYIIGLDIGTTSVGWSVQNQYNKVLKYKDKKMWGVRLFEKGEVASLRRSFRSNRRRLARRKYRITLLQELIRPEMVKKDPDFFIRLKETYLYQEDKTSKSQYNLFIDDNYNDKNFFEMFPTIYHLRRHLIDNEVDDIRLVYLALHHIIKYRGNFLYEHQEFDVQKIDLNVSLKEVFNILEEYLDFSKVNDLLLEDLSEILTSKTVNKTEKSELLEEKLKEVFFNSNQMKVFTRLITGRESNLVNFFDIEDLDKSEKDLLKINFSKEKYEENKDDIFEILGEQAEIIEKIKELYNVIFLAGMFKNASNPYISEVMINKYKKHEKDLKTLKRLLKKYYSKEDYNSFFKEENIGFNYYSYLRKPLEMKKELKLNDTYLDFIKKIEKLLLTKELKGNEDYEYCLREIQNETFLEKLNTTENGMYPYQVHRIELELILKKQGKKFPVLLEEYKGKSKIISLLEFRIPYYVGPLNNYHKKEDGYFSWIIRKETGAVTPWNFEEKVDVESSAEKFITSMTNNCTYFVNEKVIPKNSLLYTKYMVLSEIKQIKVNNHLLSPMIYQELLDEFVYGNKVNITKKDLEKWLKEKGLFPGEELEITGFQKENGFATNMKPYRDFLKIFANIEENYNMIEKLIEWITLFEDKKILRKRIEKFYPELTKEQVNKIIKLNYSGWSRLSSKFLTSRYLNYDGSKKSMMELLMQEKINMMQIMKNEEYGFDEALKLENFGTNEIEEIEYNDIARLSGSPAIKKAIWQSIKIIKEIVSLTQEKPKNIFIEMARSDEESKRTKSRKNQLLDLYKNIDKNFPGYKELVNQLKDISDEKLRNIKFYLYYSQLGKCLYSGDSIHIDELNTDLYEIDHIIPRHLIKDDSINNLALVTRKANQDKGSNLTLSGDVINKMKLFWGVLIKSNLMSPKKYNNLNRRKFSESDVEGFINRDLVETRQITKHVANLLDKYYGEGTVATVKSKIISDFRDKYSIYKVRNLNNYHHAIDAYLCAALGNYTITRYPKLKREFIYKDYMKIELSYNERRKTKYGFILDSLNHGEYVNQVTGEVINLNEWLNNIIKHTNYQDILISKKTEMNSGQFYNQTLMSPKSKVKDLISVKEKRDPKKYGGYTGEQIAYSVLIDYQKGKKRERTLVGVPIRIAISNKREELLKNHFEKQLKTNNYNVLKDKIMKNQLIVYKGQLCYLASSSEVVNAVELHVTAKERESLYKILNNKKFKWDQIELDKNKEIFIEIIEKAISKFPLLKTEFELINKYVKSDYFKELKLSELEKFVNEFLKLVSASSTNGNFSYFKNDEFKFTERMGRRSGQNVSSGKLIFTSITGLRRKEYEF